MPLPAGSRLGPYQVVQALGAGGMGEVYLARDPRLGREVAIKVLPADHVQDDARRKRFLQEARAASALNHPHIVTIHEIESADGVDFIVMEYVRGATLGKLIPQRGLPVRDVLRLAIPIADALSAAHARGIVHRDIKPANVVVSDEGVVKVLDFGLAKHIGNDRDDPSEMGATLTSPEPLTREGAIAGTVAYMSPEQATGGRLDARSDVFAFGVVLYEMLTGRRPFAGNSASDVIMAVVRDEPQPLAELAPGVPEPLERIVQRCLRKDPQRRIQHMGDVKLELQELAETAEREPHRSGTASASAAATVRERDVRDTDAARRGRWLLPAAVAVLLAAASAIGLLFRARTPPAPARPLEVVPFTSLPGLETAPSFSPDGSQIAFAWKDEGQAGYDLYIKVIGSERVLRLTHSPASWISPAWSPDGRVIAFSRGGSQGREGSGTFLVPALGGQERKLSDHAEADARSVLSWSPDGKLLAHPKDDTVEIVDVATLQGRALPQPAAECAGTLTAVFSPDGQSLASVCLVNQGLFAIFVGPVAGGGARKLATVHVSVDGLAYAPDGRHVIYASRGSLWRLPVSGGPPEKILGEQGALFPAVARTGGRLAYSQELTNHNLWRVSLADRLRVQGPPARLVTSTRSQTGPAFSPDGRLVAFASNRTGSDEIWICRADGSDPVQLTNFRGPLTGSPVWSPDGGEVLFDSRPEGDAVLFAVGVQGGVPRRVDTGVRNSSQPSFSKDGRRMYFVGEDESGVRIFATPYPAGRPAPLAGASGYFPRESADGKRVFFLRWPELWSAPLDGGAARAVDGFPRFVDGRLSDWAPAPGGLYFVDGDGSRAALAFFDLEARRAQRIVDLQNPSPWVGIAVSPDGRSVLYSQLDRHTADIMLAEGLP